MPKVKSLKTDSRYIPNRIYGIDFSGAKDAGNRIWIASAVIVGSTIVIEDCYQARHLPGSATERDQCLSTLRHFISSQKGCACGLDFPFGLPGKLVEASSWEEFVLSFGSRYPNPKKFRQSCWETAGNCEEKRYTDRQSKTPFSPYNLRLYRQTYYGIRDILAPLVGDQAVSVLPVQSWSPVKPWLLEVCPASTLERMGLRQPYKGHNNDRNKRANRAYILKEIENTGLVTIKSPALRATILDSPGGDALDSVIAAFATFRAIGSFIDSSASATSNSMLEGHVYI
jgi:hypothetical protein